MKKVKNIFKNKVVWASVIAVLLGFGGTVLYLSKTDSTKKEQGRGETKVDNNASSDTQNDKGGSGASSPDATTQAPPPVQEQPPTSSPSSLGNIVSSVTAEKNSSDDSIDILFYPESSGAFTVQEKSGAAWVTTKENQNYGGHGGFLAGSISSGQTSKTLRVLKIENGKYVSTTKEFTVNRSEVEASLGIKTYN